MSSNTIQLIIYVEVHKGISRADNKERKLWIVLFEGMERQWRVCLCRNEQKVVVVVRGISKCFHKKDLHLYDIVNVPFLECFELASNETIHDDQRWTTCPFHGRYNQHRTGTEIPSASTWTSEDMRCARIFFFTKITTHFINRGCPISPKWSIVGCISTTSCNMSLSSHSSSRKCTASSHTSGAASYSCVRRRRRVHALAFADPRIRSPKCWVAKRRIC